MELTDEGEETADEPVVERERPRLFRMPDVRADLRALPSIFLSRRLLWLPPVLLLIGFVATLMLPGLAPEAAGIADLYIQFFFLPPALFTFFIAGFVAPRASYLFGLLYGLLGGVLWSIVIFNTGTLLAPADGAPVLAVEPTAVLGQMLLIGALYGTLASAFAAWYRDFLRGMQERGKARRAEQAARERTKRRDERHESRRPTKGRPSG